ncbi:MAG: hypothetical protein Fur0010_25690 [Bdellovibrio sp.]
MKTIDQMIYAKFPRRQDSFPGNSFYNVNFADIRRCQSYVFDSPDSYENNEESLNTQDLISIQLELIWVREDMSRNGIDESSEENLLSNMSHILFKHAGIKNTHNLINGCEHLIDVHLGILINERLNLMNLISENLDLVCLDTDVLDLKETKSELLVQAFIMLEEVDLRICSLLGWHYKEIISRSDFYIEYQNLYNHSLDEHFS